MTWSGATGLDPKASLESFTGPSGDEIAAVAPGQSEIPTETAAEENSDAAIAFQIAELALESLPADTQAEIADAMPLPPVPKPVMHRSVAEVCETLTHAAQRNDLPAPFFIRLLFQESRFKPGEVSSAGAQGVAQFMPGTAADMGLDNPFDPLQAIPASARLLRNLVTQFGNLGLAAAAYNAGPGRVQAWLDKAAGKKSDKKGEKKLVKKEDKKEDKKDTKQESKKDDKKPQLPDETQDYVKIITGHAVETWMSAAASHPGQKLSRRAPCQEAAGLYAWSGPDAIPLPTPSPRTQVAAAKAPVTVASAKSAAAKPAAAPEAKVASQQLAANNQKPATHKLEKVAQR